MDGLLILMENPQRIWMIWEYPYFRTPPNSTPKNPWLGGVSQNDSMGFLSIFRPSCRWDIPTNLHLHLHIYIYITYIQCMYVYIYMMYVYIYIWVISHLLCPLAKWDAPQFWKPAAEEWKGGQGISAGLGWFWGKYDVKMTHPQIAKNDGFGRGSHSATQMYFFRLVSWWVVQQDWEYRCH